MTLDPKTFESVNTPSDRVRPSQENESSLTTLQFSNRLKIVLLESRPIAA